jgi:hypothetical protein
VRTGFVTIAIFVSLAACRKSAPVINDDACIGEASATRAFVYLHGRDSQAPSSQEMHNRDVLRRIARELGARIALPRSQLPCNDDASQICWGWGFDDGELARTAKAAQGAADRCFAHDTKYVLVGFSNGGYALDKMVARCRLGELLPHATRVVTVGAAMFKGPLADAPSDLSACGDVTMIAGTKDEWNFDPSDHYVNELKARGAHARAVHVPGGAHELAFDALRDQLFLQTSTTD